MKMKDQIISFSYDISKREGEGASNSPPPPRALSGSDTDAVAAKRERNNSTYNLFSPKRQTINETDPASF